MRAAVVVLRADSLANAAYTKGCTNANLMLPQHFTTARTARYISLGEPGPAVQHIWFCLHGEGQLLSDFAAQLVNLDTPERLLILPEGLSRFGLPAADSAPTETTAAAWFSPETLEIDMDDLTAYLDSLAAQVLPACPAGTPVTVLGYGQGAAAACRWLAAGNTHYDKLLLYASVFPPEIDRRATLEALPIQPVVVLTTTTDIFTPEVSGEGLVHDFQEAGHSANCATYQVTGCG